MRLQAPLARAAMVVLVLAVGVFVSSRLRHPTPDLWET